MNKGFSIQDSFLTEAKIQNIYLTIFLVNGYQIRGTVRAYDNYTIVMESDNKQQLIYKHAISTIVPNNPINFE